MKIIDGHIHTKFSHEDFSEAERLAGTDYSWKGLFKEMKQNNIETCVVMTYDFKGTALAEEYRIKEHQKNKIIIIMGINPQKINKIELSKLEKLLKNNIIAGVKIYLGYINKHANDKTYQKVYALCDKYSKTVVFHTGDTIKDDALLKYSHPLQIDEMAVKYRKARFVMAHCGNPWLMDAAAVAYKNRNVYIDLSGMIIGNAFPSYLRNELKKVYEYVGNPEKFLYGTDWPLVKMKTYIKFMKTVIPKKDHDKFFYQNAKKVFGIK